MIVKETWPNGLGFDVIETDHFGEEVELAEVHLLPGQPHIGVRSWNTQKSMAFPKEFSLLGTPVALDPTADLRRLLDVTDTHGEDLY